MTLLLLLSLGGRGRCNTHLVDALLAALALVMVQA